MNIKTSEGLQTEVKTLSRKLRATYLVFGAVLLAQAVFFRRKLAGGQRDCRQFRQNYQNARHHCR